MWEVWRARGEDPRPPICRNEVLRFRNTWRVKLPRILIIGDHAALRSIIARGSRGPGANIILEKPFAIRELVAAADRLLHTARET